MRPTKQSDTDSYDSGMKHSRNPAEGEERERERVLYVICLNVSKDEFDTQLYMFGNV